MGFRVYVGSQAGVLTIVMSYSLYPEVLAPQQATEVAQALSWTLDNAARLGGDPAEVSLGTPYPAYFIFRVKHMTALRGVVSSLLLRTANS